MIQEKIKDQINKTVKELSLPKNVSFKVEHPENDSYGDYTSNIALTLFPKLKKSKKYNSQFKLAQAIASKLLSNNDLSLLVDKIKVVNPGFINISIKTSWLISQLEKVLITKDKYGYSSINKNKKIMVEYTDPNPFKQFHVGHLYSNSVGESIARLKEASGAKVWRADFYGDVGMHVAKSIWGILNKFKKDSFTINDLAKWPLKKRIEYFGKAYALGASNYKDDKIARKEIQILNFIIYKASQEFILKQKNKKPTVDYQKYIKDSKFNFKKISQIYKIGRSWSLEYFETLYKRLGTKFDGFYPESITGEYGYKIMLEGLKKGVLEKADKGAIIFDGKKLGLHKRVFVNAMGLPTYETKDLGLAVVKYEDFPYDQSYNVTGNEITEYFKVVLAALKKLRPTLGNSTFHIGHGMVRLSEGKMSSRTGKIIKGEWVLDEAKKRVLKIISASSSIDSSQKDKTAEIIAIGAVKYAFLKQGIGNDIAFDFNSSLSFEGNSGPYLQYTFARTQSVLLKSNQKNINLNKEKYLNLNQEELAILKWLYRFEEVIIAASNNNSPHLVCNYLYKLAKRFNIFYNKHSILSPIKGSNKKEDLEKTIKLRLAITIATGHILKNGLKLLGIKTPIKM